MVDISILENKFSSLKKNYDEACTSLKIYETSLTSLEEEKKNLLQRQIDIAQARAIIQEVSLKTQKNLEFHVSSLVTFAIKAVSSEWPNYLIEFVERRNKVECDLLFEEKGRKQHPLMGGGGGPKDISAFSQLISYWTLNKNNPFFFLDEPFRQVSPDLQDKVSDMLKMICEKVHLQILMISHAENINIAADRTFCTKRENDVTTMEVL